MLIIIVSFSHLGRHRRHRRNRSEAADLLGRIVVETVGLWPARSRRLLTPPTFQPQVQITSDIDPMMDQTTPVHHRDPPEFRGQYSPAAEPASRSMSTRRRWRRPATARAISTRRSQPRSSGFIGAGKARRHPDRSCLRPSFRRYDDLVLAIDPDQPVALLTVILTRAALNPRGASAHQRLFVLRYVPSE